MEMRLLRIFYDFVVVVAEDDENWGSFFCIRDNCNFSEEREEILVKDIQCDTFSPDDQNQDLHGCNQS